MGKIKVEEAKEKQREQMIEFITKSLKQIDDEKLSAVHRLVLHIK